MTFFLRVGAIIHRETAIVHGGTHPVLSIFLIVTTCWITATDGSGNGRSCQPVGLVCGNDGVKPYLIHIKQ